MARSSLGREQAEVADRAESRGADWVGNVEQGKESGAVDQAGEGDQSATREG